MPRFVLISKHSPENCPMFNAKSRKIYMEAMEKIDALMKKHKVKLLASATVPNEHTDYEIYEAPSFEAFDELGMEPAIIAMGEFLTMEIKPAMSPEETAQMFKHMK
jgi:hypothetical protein